jgi:hypothetical protein
VKPPQPMEAVLAEDARLRISLSTGEIEIAGPPDFVAKYDSEFRSVLDKLGHGVVHAPPVPNVGAALTTPAQTASDGLAGMAFGEIIHALPRGASGTDQILVAGYFSARGSADKTFSTGDANKLLVEQGIKLSNASQAMKNNLQQKRVFKVGNRFRLSKPGEDYVATLVKL